MADEDIEQCFRDQGFEAVRLLPNGEYAACAMVFSTGLFVGWSEHGYARRYLYEHALDAVRALMAWDGEGDPPGPWRREEEKREEERPELVPHRRPRKHERRKPESQPREGQHMMRELTNAERASLYNKRRCPFCSGDKFFEGPHGGLSVNWYCAECGAGFNLTPVGGAVLGQLIREPTSGIVDMMGLFLKGTVNAIAALEKMAPPPDSTEGRLLVELRTCEARYARGAIPLRV